jgi:hypothetical protein
MVWRAPMVDESFRRRLGEILGKKENPTPRTLSEIVKMSGYSRATIYKWMKELESKGEVEKRSVIKGRGRPIVVYHPGAAISAAEKMSRSENSTSMLGVFPVHFERLQHVCIHSRYGYCKETVQECHPDMCPLIQKKAELPHRKRADRK